jgi:hypothetical protein
MEPSNNNDWKLTYLASPSQTKTKSRSKTSPKPIQPATSTMTFHQSVTARMLKSLGHVLVEPGLLGVLQLENPGRHGGAVAARSTTNRSGR